jgi:hypothetical protein
MLLHVRLVLDENQERVFIRVLVSLANNRPTIAPILIPQRPSEVSTDQAARQYIISSLV